MVENECSINFGSVVIEVLLCISAGLTLKSLFLIIVLACILVDGW